MKDKTRPAPGYWGEKKGGSILEFGWRNFKGINPQTGYGGKLEAGEKIKVFISQQSSHPVQERLRNAMDSRPISFHQAEA